jgi:hypothetical protein
MAGQLIARLRGLISRYNIFALVYRRIGPLNKTTQQFLNMVQEAAPMIVSEQQALSLP